MGSLLRLSSQSSLSGRIHPVSGDQVRFLCSVGDSLVAMAFGSWQVLLGDDLLPIGFFIVLGGTIKTDQNWIAQELDGS